MKHMKMWCLFLLLSMVLSACSGGEEQDKDVLTEDVQTEEDVQVEEEQDTGEGAEQKEDLQELEASLPMDFVYASESGDWYTLLTLDENFTFEGHFYYSLPGEGGYDYDERIEQCLFRGEFKDVTKASQTKYELTLDTMEVLTPQDEAVIDGILQVGVPPRGLEDSQNFELYLPDANVSEIPAMDTTVPWMTHTVDGSWNPNAAVSGQTTGCYELFNKDKNYIFVSNGQEPKIDCEDGVLAILDTTTNVAHSPYCGEVTNIPQENRKLIITPHFALEEQGYSYDLNCAWG